MNTQSLIAIIVLLFSFSGLAQVTPKGLVRFHLNYGSITGFYHATSKLKFFTKNQEETLTLKLDGGLEVKVVSPTGQPGAINSLYEALRSGTNIHYDLGVCLRKAGVKSSVVKVASIKSGRVQDIKYEIAEVPKDQLVCETYDLLPRIGDKGPGITKVYPGLDVYTKIEVIGEPKNKNVARK